MLAQCEQPPAAKLPAFRAALITLETAFYILLWSIARKDLFYSLPDPL